MAYTRNIILVTEATGHHGGAATRHALAGSGEVSDLDVDFSADAILAAIAPPLVAFQQHQRGFSRERIAAGVRRLFVVGIRQPR